MGAGPFSEAIEGEDGGQMGTVFERQFPLVCPEANTPRGFVWVPLKEARADWGGVGAVLEEGELDTQAIVEKSLSAVEDGVLVALLFVEGQEIGSGFHVIE